MSQRQVEQYNKEDFELLETIDELLESAELELQKTATLLELNTNAEQAFEGVTAITKEIEEFALRLKEDDLRMIAFEKITVFSARFNEVVNQIQN